MVDKLKVSISFEFEGTPEDARQEGETQLEFLRTRYCWAHQLEVGYPEETARRIVARWERETTATFALTDDDIRKLRRTIKEELLLCDARH